MAHLLDLPFDTASIEPDGSSSGQVRLSDLRWMARSEPTDPMFRLWVERSVMAHMAGFLAERALTRRGNWKAARSDLASTFEMADVVSFTPRERDRYLDWLFARTEFMMKWRSLHRAVTAVAAELLRRRTLSSRSVAIVANRVWRELRRRRRGRRVAAPPDPLGPLGRNHGQPGVGQDETPRAVAPRARAASHSRGRTACTAR